MCACLSIELYLAGEIEERREVLLPREDEEGEEEEENFSSPCCSCECGLGVGK